MEIQRLLSNVCSYDLEQSKNFYTSLFDFSVAYESDWFVHLVALGKTLELGIIAADHEIVPEHTRGDVAGVYLSFVVKDVDLVFQQAMQLGYDIQQAPEVTFYGQKRMLLLAPEGTVCDISSPT